MATADAENSRGDPIPPRRALRAKLVVNLNRLAAAHQIAQHQAPACLHLHHLVKAHHRAAQCAQIVAGLDRFLPTALVEVVVDNVAPPRSRPAGAKVLERACLDHLVVELAECLGELILAYAGLCAHRLEVGGDGAHTLFFPAAPPRPASQMLKRFIGSRNPHRPNSQNQPGCDRSHRRSAHLAR